MITRGLDKASTLNTIVMLAKLVPIFIFIVILLFAFQRDIFFQDFWGTKAGSGISLSILDQLKGSVLATVWVFIGIEGAVVFSGRAKKNSIILRKLASINHLTEERLGNFKRFFQSNGYLSWNIQANLGFLHNYVDFIVLKAF